MVKPGDIVVYVGEDSENFRGCVGITIKPWNRNGFPKESAWEVEWLFLPGFTEDNKLWFFERNLHKLGEVQHG